MSDAQPHDWSEDARNKNQEDLDEVVLLRLFPEETWKPILKRMKDLKSLENLSNSSPFFHERLLSRRVMFIFPGVFEIFMQKNEEDDELFCVDDNDSEEDVEENSKVEDAVDENYEENQALEENGVEDDVNENYEEINAVEENGVEQNNEEDHEDENIEEENDRDDDEEEIDSDNDAEDDVEKATEMNEVWNFPWSLRLVCLDWNKIIDSYFQDLKINPFVNKRHYFHIPGPTTAFVQESTKMLAKFGQTLQFAIVGLNLEDRENLEDIYLLFVNLLQYVPRLIELYICCERVQIENTHENRLSLAIQTNKCPKMENLEFLSVVGCLPTQIFVEVVRQNLHFTKLKVCSKNSDVTRFDFAMPLPNLAVLDILIESYEDFEKIKYCGKNWKLTTFCCKFMYSMDKKKWIEVFEMIADNWGDILVELAIDFTIAREDIYSMDSVCVMGLNLTTNERLNGFKKLKRIFLDSEFVISLDFLLSCQETLEYMKVIQIRALNRKSEQNPQYIDDMKRQIVEFCGREDSMEDSNIWVFFPRLQCYQFFDNPTMRPAKYRLP